MKYDLAEALPYREYPRCHVCKMPVLYCGIELIGDGRVYFVTVCHGAIEVISFTLDEFDRFTEIEFGEAFAAPQTRPKLLGS